MTRKTVLITGASKGIGKSISKKLLKEGWQVIGLARDFSSQPITDTNFVPYEVDLSRLDTLPERLKSIQMKFPRIDAVINNVGKGYFAHLEECSVEKIREVMDLNFLSHVIVTKAFLPTLKRQGSGKIIFIGSEAALAGKQKGTLYCASKFALRGFSQALRDECASSGVAVCLINPGMVKTGFFDGLGFEPGDDEAEHIVPEDVAEMVFSVLQMRKGTVLEEINLSPQKKKIKFSHH